MLLVTSLSVQIYADDAKYLYGNAKSEKEMYENLVSHSGHEILKEYIELENKGASVLIPYACALVDKYDEFESQEIVSLLLQEETLSEVESVLVELLDRKGEDFNKYLELQEAETVEMNTKQLLLLNKSVNINEWKKYVNLGKDFRTRSAMQMISFTDERLALGIAIDLLRNEPTYYQISAINIAVNQYYRDHPEDKTHKEEIITMLLDLYSKSKDEQERFWIMDSLGCLQDYTLFLEVLDNDNIQNWDKYVFLFSSSKLIDRLEKNDCKENLDYREKYSCLMSEEELYNNLKEMLNTSSVAWRGYAVYRDGVLGSLNHHAALMHYNSITGGSSYSSYPNANDVIQASGPSYTVDKESWSTFLDGHSFVAACKPVTCSMSNSDIVHFIYKGTTLIGTAYVFVRQITYNQLYDNSIVEPSRITALRCDGVIEYVYEYYGYKVGGASNNWNITIDNSSNYAAHNLYNITPKIQNESLLTRVTTLQSDLY